MDYEIIQMNNNTWRIENKGVRFFLLTGTEKALLIDSGMTVHGARDIAVTLTDLPIDLLNTHADKDYIGSNVRNHCADRVCSALQQCVRGAVVL